MRGRVEGMPQTEECDVLVIGGGPGGSTISALLARKGWRVTMVEKDFHPRFHIGESLLPHNLKIFDDLGILEDLEAIGRFKPGADFTAPDYDGRMNVKFAMAFGPCPPNSYQVKRADLDHLLFKTAATAGATVVEGVKVKDVAFRGDGSVRVAGSSTEGRPRAWTARFLVDASGRDTFMGNKLRLKERNPRHRSAALYAHYAGVEPRRGDETGNISIYWFAHGWFWSIPLRDGLTSIGAVCRPDYLQSRRMALEDFLRQTIAQCPGLDARMKEATIATAAATTGNYSYSCRKMWGDRFLMIGDAYSFIDPVFSSGVYLAMQGAVFGAATVDACLRKPARQATYMRRHAAKVERGLRTLSWFIYRFNEPAFRRLFMRPRNILRMRDGIVSFLAGDVYGDPRLRLPFAAFKLVYFFTRLGMARAERRQQPIAEPPGGALGPPASER